MAPKFQEKAKAAYADEMPANVRARHLRNRMAAQWGYVLTMLETGKRKDAQGRTLTEAWADMVLADPAGEFSRVCADILPKETADAVQSGATLSIQQLYLTAVQAAQSAPNPKQIDGQSKPLETKEEW